jgi:hypothetical protein
LFIFFIFFARPHLKTKKDREERERERGKEMEKA